MLVLSSDVASRYYATVLNMAAPIPEIMDEVVFHVVYA
jgi:hypothetical protein